jgi:hypothetical protein
LRVSSLGIKGRYFASWTVFTSMEY